LGDMLQGVAGDCNSPEATHAWFDSRVAHHFSFFPTQNPPLPAENPPFDGVAKDQLKESDLHFRLNHST